MLKKYIKQMDNDDYIKEINEIQTKLKIHLGKMEDNKEIKVNLSNMTEEYNYYHISFNFHKKLKDRDVKFTEAEVLKNFRNSICSILYFLYGSHYNNKIKKKRTKNIDFMVCFEYPNANEWAGRHFHLITYTPLPLILALFIYDIMYEYLIRIYPDLTSYCSAIPKTNEKHNLFKADDYDRKEKNTIIYTQEQFMNGIVNKHIKQRKLEKWNKTN